MISIKLCLFFFFVLLWSSSYCSLLTSEITFINNLQPSFSSPVNVLMNSSSSCKNLNFGETCNLRFLPGDWEIGLSHELNRSLTRTLFGSYKLIKHRHYSLAFYADKNGRVLNSFFESDLTEDFSLDVDTARLTIVNGIVSDANLTVYGVSSNCDKCKKPVIWKNDNFTFEFNTTVDTNFPFDFFIDCYIYNENISDFAYLTWNVSYQFGERGTYLMFISTTDIHTLHVDIKQVLPTSNTYLPILVAAFILLFIAFFYVILLYGYRQYVLKKITQDDSSNNLLDGLKGINNSADNFHPNDNKAPNQAPKKKRVKSLDAFRGMSLTIMIFVNYGGGHYWFFNHSVWNGLTVADLVFPWFIWIMGVSMAISLGSLERSKTRKFDVIFKILKRSLILIGLGLFLNNGFYLNSWRFPGVLQRFGISYLVVALNATLIPKIWTPKVNILSDSKTKNQKPAMFDDLKPYLLQWPIPLILLTIYLLLTFLLPVPGCPTGYLGPGGLHEWGRYWNCTGGAALQVDKQIFGIQHIYQWPTCRTLYETGAFDPEGFLGFMTSIFLCFLGLQCGRILTCYQKHKQRLIRWIIWGIFFSALGTLLCNASKNDGWVPLNKNLWSVSFIFVMGGTGFLLLSIFYVFIDVYPLWNGSPFFFVGMNSIVIYCGSEVLQNYFPFSYSTVNSHAALLASNLIGVGVWCLIAYWMYHIKFFVNI